jgi:hypothetical protein
MPHPRLPECASDEEAIESIKDVVSKIGRPPKDASDMEDAESTGRKQAAKLLPTEILDTMICEWALLKEAGGGIHPITGCHGNKATDRHHGPNKNTLYNERRVNLHAICSYCHNLWHAKNDNTYEGTRPKDDTPWNPVGEFKPHDPNGERITIQQALLNELTRYK